MATVLCPINYAVWYACGGSCKGVVFHLVTKENIKALLLTCWYLKSSVISPPNKNAKFSHDTKLWPDWGEGEHQIWFTKSRAKTYSLCSHFIEMSLLMAVLDISSYADTCWLYSNCFWFLSLLYLHSFLNHGLKCVCCLLLSFQKLSVQVRQFLVKNRQEITKYS